MYIYRLTGSVVVDALELSDVSVLHHHRQELDDDFRVGSDENLSLASLLRVIDRLQMEKRMIVMLLVQLCACVQKEPF